MSLDSSTLTHTRRKRMKLDALETTQALGYLMEARNEQGITPRRSIAPSACHLLILNGWLPGRASYVLHILTGDGIIRPIDHSLKYEILRPDLYVKDFPKYEPPQAQESSVQPEPVPAPAPAPAPPRPAVPTPRDIMPKLIAARENTDLVLLKHRLEGAIRNADSIGRDLEKAQGEVERLQGVISELKGKESDVDARVAEAEARIAEADARANAATSRALTAQSQLNAANQTLARYRAWEEKVSVWAGKLPQL